MGYALKTRRSIVGVQFNGHEVLADIIVDSDRTFQEFVGLNINKGDVIIITAEVINSTSEYIRCRLFANAHKADSDYKTIGLNFNGGVVSTAFLDLNDFVEVNGNTKTLTTATMKISNDGYFEVQANMSREYGTSGIRAMENYISSTFAMTTLTRLTVSSTVANGIGVGSRFQLYRIAGGDA